MIEISMSALKKVNKWGDIICYFMRLIDFCLLKFSVHYIVFYQ